MAIKDYLKTETSYTATCAICRNEKKFHPKSPSAAENILKAYGWREIHVMMSLGKASVVSDPEQAVRNIDGLGCASCVEKFNLR